MAQIVCPSVVFAQATYSISRPTPSSKMSLVDTQSPRLKIAQQQIGTDPENPSTSGSRLVNIFSPLFCAFSKFRFTRMQAYVHNTSVHTSAKRAAACGVPVLLPCVPCGVPVPYHVRRRHPWRHPVPWHPWRPVPYHVRRRHPWRPWQQVQQFRRPVPVPVPWHPVPL